MTATLSFTANVFLLSSAVLEFVLKHLVKRTIPSAKLPSHTNYFIPLKILLVFVTTVHRFSQVSTERGK